MDDSFEFSSSGNGFHAPEEDPAAAFLAQQESEIAGIENEGDGFGLQSHYDAFEDEKAAVNGDMFQTSNGTADGYAAIAQVDQLRQEPESLRKWREEQKTRLEQLDAASKASEAEWKEKARKELEEWHVHQSDQLEKNKANNRIADQAFYQQPNSDVIGLVASEEAFLKDSEEDGPGSEWEKVARLCDFNPKTNKQCKDVSRMRSVLISLKQTPLVRKA
ncbi:clathrin light chain B isoform X1 [Denticeps clupeoides]|uniref:Clathrin light chain n=1 Tax=Denticeps clupeoides TaxID=299321 RepID=A0AAY4B5V2_9TELE|nr:clathrin light chain B-like isoform X1 [Denticeps clupeoides]